jgi:hypothetical protein
LNPKMTIAIALVLMLAACAPAGEPPDSIPAPAAAGAERLEGTVRIVGSAPVNVQVVLQPEQGRAVRLVGPLATELEQLSGVEVSVTGRVERSSDPVTDRQIHASSYRILRVDGAPVVMGEIVSVTGGSARLRTEEGDEVLLSGVPASFRVGQKVWVQGPRTIAVQSFGTIRR